ncbi:MAG: Fe-S cluster assembly protein SufB [Patescibacteria group bacterium]
MALNLESIKTRMSYVSKRGLSRRLIEEISWHKQEPEWMRKLRLKSFDIFLKKSMPNWGPDLSKLDFDKLAMYIKPGAKKAKDWKNVPKEIKQVYDKLGIPEAEKKYLAGQVSQFESEAVYHKLKAQYEAQGIIFCDMDSAVKKYPDIVKEYFMTKCVPMGDHKFSALHGAVWSGGSFVYVPKGVKVDLPVQTYFWMNTKGSGQFEHTLIIAEEGSEIHYIEGCTAPQYSEQSLHSAVVEIFVKKNAKVRYTTVQNWSKDVYNLNTKRAIVGPGASIEWVGGSMGSGVTMLYPASYLVGRGARADHLNIAFAGHGQIKDTGAKVFHGAPNTSSTVVSKSICRGGGQGIYRGVVKIAKGAKGAKTHVRCDSLILDDQSIAKTYPHLEIYENEVSAGHEATTGKISDDQIFYLRSRGLTEQEAMAMIVSGFVEPIVKELPMEYAIELNRLILLEMDNSVG